LTIKITELQRLGKDHDEAYYTILSMLEMAKPKEFSEENVKIEINKAIKVYHDICKVVLQAQVELYGEITQAEVSFSSVPGKAILVSGSDFKKLEIILKAVENTEINVYTHGLEMFMAHSFPKFNSHKNLKGHFGTSLESSLIDFASFPGPILMTKGTLQKIDYLFRGRLFTFDPIAPMGVIRLNDNNLEPLIKSAQEGEGFRHSQTKPSLQVGFDEKKLNKLMDNIIDKINKKGIKHLYFIGVYNSQNFIYKEYFTKFFKLLPDNCFVFSLSYPINGKNIFHLDSFYDYTLLFKCLQRLKDEFSFDDLNLHVFLTKCDKHTISNLLYFKHIKVKDIYMCKCPPTLIGPSIITTLQDRFGIKEFSDPQNDIKETLKDG